MRLNAGLIMPAERFVPNVYCDVDLRVDVWVYACVLPCLHVYTQICSCACAYMLRWTSASSIQLKNTNPLKKSIWIIVNQRFEEKLHLNWTKIRMQFKMLFVNHVPSCSILKMFIMFPKNVVISTKRSVCVPDSKNATHVLAYYLFWTSRHFHINHLFNDFLKDWCLGSSNQMAVWIMQAMQSLSY